ncbi:MAG: LysR family transcriptional regulator [Burkholderiales bacterium]|jgi:DNA-binding transcriptional LysR family regulator|nr:LysR family transcriptional regulator [Burkholderiales bacterium]
MDRLQSMEVFLRVVEKGGLSAAAETFAISPTMVGKHVRSLEERLGGRLLNRTTRRQSLTELGRTYYERCRQLVADFEAIENTVSEMRASPRGVLRINAPASFGSMQLAPALADYLERYPEVQVDLTLSDRVVDLVEEGYELAVRVGTLGDSGLVARKLAPFHLTVCASPAYLAKHGKPKAPRDLLQHNCLEFTYGGGHRWLFESPAGKETIAIKGNLKINNGAALLEAALQGIGIILQPETLVADDIAAGRLVPLLSRYQPAPRPVHLVYLPDRRLSPKLRSFIEFLVERFGETLVPVVGAGGRLAPARAKSRSSRTRQ